jgi:tartronate-semialdehyde synthase
LPALGQAKKLTDTYRVPVVVEVILERITNVSMGNAIDAVNEFEELAESAADAPAAVYAPRALAGGGGR